MKAARRREGNSPPRRMSYGPTFPYQPDIEIQIPWSMSKTGNGFLLHGNAMSFDLFVNGLGP
jgi:hypothetical protein